MQADWERCFCGTRKRFWRIRNTNYKVKLPMVQHHLGKNLSLNLSPRLKTLAICLEGRVRWMSIHSRGKSRIREGKEWIDRIAMTRWSVRETKPKPWLAIECLSQRITVISSALFTKLQNKASSSKITMPETKKISHLHPISRTSTRRYSSSAFPSHLASNY